MVGITSSLNSMIAKQTIYRRFIVIEIILLTSWLRVYIMVARLTLSCFTAGRLVHISVYIVVEIKFSHH